MKYIVYLVAFIAIVFLISTLNTDINLHIASYAVSTSLSKLLVLLFIIYIPIYIIKKIIKKIINKIKQGSYNSNVLYFIGSINDEKSKKIALDILKNSENINFLKKIKNIKKLIDSNKYDKAISIINTTKFKSYNEDILLKYLCISYKQKEDLANFIIYAKKGVYLKKDPLWFLAELFDISFKNKALNSEIIYLYNYIKSIKNTNEEEYKKYFCLISYFYAQFLFKNADIEKSKEVTKKTIKLYPDFSPIYEILFKIYKTQNKKNRINDFLKTLWKHNKSYDSILFWQKYYTEKDNSKILSDIGTEYTKNENNLLLASIYANNDNFLEAHNLVQNIKSTNLTKNLVELNIMQKENNYNTAGKVVIELLKNTKTINFWNNYIN